MPNPIAQWGNVPFQRFTDDTIHIPVLANHILGINRVEYTVTDGVTPQTGSLTARSFEQTQHREDCLWCYAIPANLTTLNDGVVTVTATAYSEPTETSTALGSWTFINDNGGAAAGNDTFIWVDPNSGDDSFAGTEAAPKRTLGGAFAAINGDGDTIYLAAGDYVWPNEPTIANANEWITVTRASTAMREDVRIVGRTQVNSNISRVRIFDVTIYTTTSPPSGERWQGLWADHVWYDKVKFEGQATASGRSQNNRAMSGGPSASGGQLTGYYLTDTEFDLFTRCIEDATLARNCTATRVSDFFITLNGNSGAVVNSRVDDINRLYSPGGLSHADTVIVLSTTDGYMLQGIRATRAASIGVSQATTACSNFSIEDFVQSAPVAVEYWLKLGGTTDHILVDNCIGWPQGIFFGGGGLTNSRLRSVATTHVAGPTSAGSMTFVNCHIETGAKPAAAAAATQGPLDLVDAAGGDLRPQITSPLYQTGATGVDAPGLPLGFRNKAKPDIGAWTMSAAPDVDLRVCSRTSFASDLNDLVLDRQSAGTVTLTGSFTPGDPVILKPGGNPQALISYTKGTETAVQVKVEFASEADPTTWYTPDAPDASLDAAVIWAGSVVASKTVAINLADLPLGTNKIGDLAAGMTHIRFQARASAGTPSGSVTIVVAQ